MSSLHTVIQVAFNTSTGHWEEVAQSDVFNISIPAPAGITTHPYRFITKIRTVVGAGDPTFEYDTLASPTSHSFSSGTDFLSFTTETLDCYLTDGTTPDLVAFNLVTTKITVTNSSLTSGSIGNYTLYVTQGGTTNNDKTITATAVTRDQTQIEIAYDTDPTGSHHWVTRTWDSNLIPDGAYNFPSGTALWDLPVAYVRHIKVLDTIDLPTGAGLIEGYANITGWYETPISTSAGWITTSTSSKVLYNQAGTQVSASATLLFINITASHSNLDASSYTLHVNPLGGTPGITDKTKLVDITAKTPVTITQDYLLPADNNSAYSFSPSLVGGKSGGTWSATGLPSDYSITPAGTIEDLASTRATRTLTQGATTDTVILTYTIHDPDNYMPYVATKTFTNGFRRYALQYSGNPSSTNLTTGIVGHPYSDVAGIKIIGDTQLSVTGTYYNAHKPTNWDGAHTLSQGLFTSNDAGTGTGIVVASDLITGSGNVVTTVDIQITVDGGGSAIVLPSGTSSFHVVRAFTIPIGTASSGFTVSPAVMTTRSAVVGGEVAATIGLQAFGSFGFADPTSKYTVTNPGYNGTVANTLFDGTYPGSGGLSDYDYVWIPLKTTATNGTYYVQFTRETTSVVLPITINNSIDTGTTAQIANVNYPGYSDPSPSTVSVTPYTFYKDSIGNVSLPLDVSQSFSVAVNTAGAHVIPPVGFFKLTPASGAGDDLTVLNYIDVYDGSGNPNAFHVIQGNSCTVKFKDGVTASSPVVATNYNGTAYLDFVTYSDGSVTGLRRAIISVKKSHSILTVNPGSITTPVVGTPVSQTFTTTGASVGTLHYSITGAGLGYFNSPTINELTGLFTGTPNSATAAYAFNVNVHDSASPTNNTGVATISGHIDPAGADPLISNIAPAAFDGNVTRSIVITGTNFGATSGTNLIQIYQPGVLYSQTTLTATAESSTQITVTYTGGQAGFVGNGAIAVTRIADGKTTSGAVSVTSSSTATITSVDTPSTTAAGSSVILTIRGTGFNGGYIGYKAYGAGTYTQYPVTVSGTTAATSTGLIPLGPQGTATVYYIQGNGTPASGAIPLTITAASLTTVTLTDTDSFIPYVGSSTQGTPTDITITRNALRHFQLSANVAATYSLGGTTLPVGFTFDGVTGIITGTATSSSVTTTFAVTANSSKTVYYRFVITGGPLTMPAQNFVVHVGEVGVSKTIVTSGGTGTVSFTMQAGSGSLPSSLALNSNGTITGNVDATTLQDYTFKAVATDQAYPAVSVTADITVTLAEAYTNPIIVNLTPSVGAISGGTPVTLNVTDIRPGFIVNIGGSVATIVSQALSNYAGPIVISTPAHALGPVNVTITNTDGRVSPAVVFTYSNIVAPYFIALSPLPYGPFAGNQQLVLTGQNFIDGMTVTFGTNNYGTGWTTSNVEVISSTLAHVKTPAYTGSGTQTIKQIVDLVLANGGESTVITGGYNYMPPPTIAAVTPPTGPSAGGTTVYITGSNFFDTPTGLKPRVFIGAVEIPAERITLIK
jgi:hypothetical protein